MNRILCVALLLVVTACGSGWSASSVEKGRQIGDEIVDALHAYKADHGRFPETLDALVPSHLSVIPPAPTGDPNWTYRRRTFGGYEAEQEAFQLSFGAVGGYPCCVTSGRRGEWHVDD